jgi:hypothetical protein
MMTDRRLIATIRSDALDLMARWVALEQAWHGAQDQLHALASSAEAERQDVFAAENRIIVEQREVERRIRELPAGSVYASAAQGMLAGRYSGDA